MNSPQRRSGRRLLGLSGCLLCMACPRVACSRILAGASVEAGCRQRVVTSAFRPKR
jgi:hypothetical protein